MSGKKVKVKVIPHAAFQKLMSRLATSYLDDVSFVTDPTSPLKVKVIQSKAKAELLMSLGQNVPYKEIEINEGVLNHETF